LRMLLTPVANGEAPDTRYRTPDTEKKGCYIFE
jgi:hypothetical protein